MRVELVDGRLDEERHSNDDMHVELRDNMRKLIEILPGKNTTLTSTMYAMCR
jgi:hypothetical protein